MHATGVPIVDDVDDLIVNHVNLARGLARRFAGRGEPIEDLRGVAEVALVAAAHRFDPERGVAFPTFATVSILGELKRYFRDRVWWVRAPRQIHDLFLRVGEARETLLQRLGRSPTSADLASYLKCSEDDVLEAMEAGYGYHAGSLDVPAKDEGPTLVDTLGEEDPGLAAGLDRIELAHALATFSGEERHLLKAYFFDNRTQMEIGRDLACSQVQVSRLLTRLLARLRQQMIEQPVVGAA